MNHFTRLTATLLQKYPLFEKCPSSPPWIQKPRERQASQRNFKPPPGPALCPPHYTAYAPGVTHTSDSINLARRRACYSARRRRSNDTILTHLLRQARTRAREIFDVACGLGPESSGTRETAMSPAGSFARRHYLARERRCGERACVRACVGGWVCVGWDRELARRFSGCSVVGAFIGWFSFCRRVIDIVVP